MALVAEVVGTLQDYVIERLHKIEGLKAFEPEGAFYVFADATNFFGPNVQAKDFGAIPDADALCRSAHLILHWYLVTLMSVAWAQIQLHDLPKIHRTLILDHELKIQIMSFLNTWPQKSLPVACVSFKLILAFLYDSASWSGVHFFCSECRQVILLESASLLKFLVDFCSKISQYCSDPFTWVAATSQILI